ncbi:MAG: tetratricopeptide repeat protein, partial [Candidatus Omnitrophota bacterium]
MPNKTIIVLFWILFFGVRPNALAAGELSSAQEALNNGYYELALGLCEKFIADGPGDKQADRAVLIRAKALFFKQEYLKSLKELNKLLRRGRNNGIADEVLYWLAEVYLKVEDYSQAGKYYQRLRNEFRGSPYRRDADYGFAWCLFKQKRFASAQKGFSAYIRNYPHSPLLPTAMLNRAESLYNLGRFEAAVGAYKKTLDILSGIDSPRQARDMAYLGLAWSYIHGGKYASAREALKKASLKRGGPDYADLLFARAKVALGAKDPEQAISLCDDLIKNYSDYDLIPEVCSAKARALCSLLRYQEAIGVYERLLSVIGGKDKEFLVDIRYNLVYAYLKNGDFIPAITQLNEISSDDSLAEDIRYSALAQIADIYRDLGEYRKALQAYKRLPQDNEYARFQAGLCYLKVGEIKKALIGLTDFRKEFPRSELVPEAEYYLCLAYFKMGNFI